MMMIITIKLAIILLLITILALSYRSKSATATKILIVYSVRQKIRYHSLPKKMHTLHVKIANFKWYKTYELSFFYF